MQLFDVPPGWKSVPMWSVASRKDRKGYSDAELLSVYREYGVIRKSDRDDNHNVESEDLSNYKFVRKGDLVLNKMKTWQGSLGVSPYEGIVSPAYYVCELSKDLHAPYIHYLLRSAPYIAMYGARSKGIRIGQWDLPYEEFREIPVLVPPFEEQCRIADYLDRKLQSIERLIESKQELANKVDAYFDVAVKDEVLGKSGDGLVNCPPWATHVEADRELIELGRLVRIRGEKNDPIKVDQVLSLTAKRGVILYEEKGDIGNVASEDISRYSIVRKGDLVVNCMNIIIGSVGISNYEGVLSPVYYVLKPIDPSKINMEFLALHFRIREFQRQLIRIGYGILDHRMRIPWVNLKAEKMAIPPISIQNAVVSRISELDKARISLQETIDTSISALQDYKISLISELVTGSIPVPNKREEVNA